MRSMHRGLMGDSLHAVRMGLMVGPTRSHVLVTGVMMTNLMVARDVEWHKGRMWRRERMRIWCF